MPAENMEEQGLAKVPNLDLAQLKFEVAQGLGEQDWKADKFNCWILSLQFFKLTQSGWK